MEEGRETEREIDRAITAGSGGSTEHFIQGISFNLAKKKENKTTGRVVCEV